VKLTASDERVGSESRVECHDFGTGDGNEASIPSVVVTLSPGSMAVKKVGEGAQRREG
jgi:hypothetical protein